jgi:anti-sigma B factor antagonist
MKIVRKVIDQIVILDITGEIRLGESAEAFSRQLEAVLNDQSVSGVVLNLEHINYMDSTGLGELVGYLSRFQDRGVRLRLVKPNQTVLKLLQLTKLDQIFKVCPDEAAALEDFVS